MNFYPDPLAVAKQHSWLKRHPVATFFGLAYLISWAIELPLVASAQGWIAWSVPFATHYLAAFGPAIAALIMTGLLDGRDGLAALGRGFGGGWQQGGWLFFALFSPVLLFALAAVMGFMVNGRWPDLALLGRVEYLPYLGIAGAFGLWLLTFGLGEELGWRGYALPRLQATHTALTSSLILGAAWTFWHLPAFWYKATYQQMGLVAGLPTLLISILAAAVVFTWLYNSTGGNLLVVIVFHAAFDFFSVSQAAGGSTAAVMSAAVMIGAVLIISICKPTNLARKPKQTQPRT